MQLVTEDDLGTTGVPAVLIIWATVGIASWATNTVELIIIPAVFFSVMGFMKGVARIYPKEPIKDIPHRVRFIISIWIMWGIAAALTIHFALPLIMIAPAVATTFMALGKSGALWNFRNW